MRIDLATVTPQALVKNGERLALHPPFSFEEQIHGLLKFSFRFTTPEGTENRVWLIIGLARKTPAKGRKTANKAFAEVHWSWRPRQLSPTKYWYPLEDFLDDSLPPTIAKHCRRIAGEDVLAQNEDLYREMLDILFETPVEPEEMHTTTGYDESIPPGLSLQQFRNLKKGDIVDYINEFNHQTQWTISTRANWQGKVVYYTGHRKNPEFPSHILKIRFYEGDRKKMSFPSPVEPEEMHTVTGYDEALIVRFEKTVSDSEPFSMWQNTDKYIPVASEEDRELLYGIEEGAVEAFLSVGKLMEDSRGVKAD